MPPGQPYAGAGRRRLRLAGRPDHHRAVWRHQPASDGAGSGGDAARQEDAPTQPAAHPVREHLQTTGTQSPRVFHESFRAIWTLFLACGIVELAANIFKMGSMGEYHFVGNKLKYGTWVILMDYCSPKPGVQHLVKMCENENQLTRVFIFVLHFTKAPKHRPLNFMVSKYLLFRCPWPNVFQYRSLSSSICSKGILITRHVSFFSDSVRNHQTSLQTRRCPRFLSRLLRFHLHICSQLSAMVELLPLLPR